MSTGRATHHYVQAIDCRCGSQAKRNAAWDERRQTARTPLAAPHRDRIVGVIRTPDTAPDSRAKPYPAWAAGSAFCIAKRSLHCNLRGRLAFQYSGINNLIAPVRWHACCDNSAVIQLPSGHGQVRPYESTAKGKTAAWSMRGHGWLEGSARNPPEPTQDELIRQGQLVRDFKNWKILKWI